MSEVKQSCQLDGCNRAGCGYCFCCNKNVCTRHFIEHIDAVKAQIDPLAKEINTMVEDIQGLTIEHLTKTSLAELQQWKIDMHQLIDEIFVIKSNEIEDLVESNKDKFVEHKKQQLETMMKIQEDVKQLVDDEDATFEQIQLLKTQLAKMESNLTSFRNDFLVINARASVKELVIVKSNLNKPNVLPPSTQTSAFFSTSTSFNTTFGISTAAQPNPAIGNVGQQSTLFAGFGTLSQSISSTLAPSTNSIFSFVGTPTTTTTSLGGGQGSLFGAPTNNPSLFGTSTSSPLTRAPANRKKK